MKFSILQCKKNSIISITQIPEGFTLNILDEKFRGWNALVAGTIHVYTYIHKVAFSITVKKMNYDTMELHDECWGLENNIDRQYKLLSNLLCFVTFIALCNKVD